MFEHARHEAISLTDLGTAIVAGLALFTVAVMLGLAAWYLSDTGGFGSLPAYSPALTNASVFITVSLVWSWANYTFVEKPILIWRNRRIGGSEVHIVPVGSQSN